jgi:hypothetical protein
MILIKLSQWFNSILAYLCFITIHIYTMPQFDTFSFSSQLFWVFLSFFCLYFALTYYILPAVSVILKIRKKKLLNSSVNTVVSTDSYIVSQKESSMPIKSISFKNSDNSLSLSSQGMNKMTLTKVVSKTIPLNLYYNLPNMLMI